MVAANGDQPFSLISNRGGGQVRAVFDIDNATDIETFIEQVDFVTTTQTVIVPTVIRIGFISIPSFEIRTITTTQRVVTLVPVRTNITLELFSATDLVLVVTGTAPK